MTETENVTVQDRMAGRRIFYGFVIILLIIFTYRFGVSQGRSGSSMGFSINPFLGQKTSSEESVDLSLFWRSWDLLKNRYVDAKDLKDNALVEGAIRGMLASTGDPYTTFLNTEENAELESDISGSFEGIGAEVGIRDKILTIISPLSGSPAEKAGLRAGDKIVKINDEETLQMSLDEAVRKMRGKKGTDVTFTIFRDGENDTRQVTVKRDRIEVKSVTVEYRDGNIAYIKLTRFGEDTMRDFEIITQDVQNYKAKGIILDMRNNPGGLLQTAVDLSGKFLRVGSVVVQEEYGDGKKDIEKTVGRGELKDIPIVVLINEGSASASEILAGALKDNRENVTIVGKKSFGKGSVQELVSLPKGAAVKITIAKWFTPSGKGIDGEGISPDVEVELTDEDFDARRDPQLDKALEIFKN